MALDSVASSILFSSNHFALSDVDRNTQTLVIDAFVDMYVVHAKTASCSTITISGTGKTALKDALLTITGSVASNVTIFADALAAFWAAEKLPKSPYKTFVSNDATSKSQDFETAISGSITTNVANSSALAFLDASDTIVKTIVYKCKTSTNSSVTGASPL